MTRSRLASAQAQLGPEDRRLVVVQLADLHLDPRREGLDQRGLVLVASPAGGAQLASAARGRSALADVEQHEDRLLGQEAEAADRRLASSSRARRSRIGRPAGQAPARLLRAPPARARWPRARRACRGGRVARSFSSRFSTTPRSATVNSRSSRSRSRHGSTRAVGMRHRRVRRTRARRGAARPRCAAAPAGRPGFVGALVALGRRRRRGQVHVGHVGRHLALGLEERGQARRGARRAP